MLYILKAGKKVYVRWMTIAVLVVKPIVSSFRRINSFSSEFLNSLQPGQVLCKVYGCLIVLSRASEGSLAG